LDVVRFCRAEVAYDFAMSHAWTIALGRYAKPTGIVEAEVLVYDPWLKYIPPFAVYPIRKIPLTDFP
jgi:hypothetical protein